MLKHILLPYKISIILQFWLLMFALPAFGENLPFKHLTTSDGLANNRVTRIFQDKKGFLWFATWEGLSLYNGYDFVNYGTRDGLANEVINDVAEDNEGRIWVANNDGGVSLLNDQTTSNGYSDHPQTKKFISFLIGTTYYSNKVNRLIIDSKNNLWCLTDDGLYRAPVSEKPVFSLIIANPTPIQDFGSRALFEDNDGNIWFGIYHELFEIHGEAQIINHGVISGYGNDFISNAIQDNGKILVLGLSNGLFEFQPTAAKWQRLSPDLQNISNFSVLMKSGSNSLWFGGDGGLLKLVDGKITKYSVEQGLIGNNIISLFQDSNDTLWIGGQLSGINKLSNETIVNYPMPVGADVYQKQLFIKKTLQFTEGSAGKSLSPTFKLIYKQNKWWIKFNVIDELPLQSSVFQLQNGSEIDVSKFFDKPLKENGAISFYDDFANSFLWFNKGAGFVYRINTNPAKENSIEKFPCELLTQNLPDLMIGDGQAGLWIFKRGLRNTHLRNGRCENLSSDGNVPDFDARSAFLDSRRWLWIGTRFNGVAVIKNPADETPDFKMFTVEDGLLSSSVWSIAEDSKKQIYLGTGKGLSILNPLNFGFQSLTTKNGLAGDLIIQLYKDSNNDIWINTENGISKITPALENEVFGNCQTYVTKINIAGEDLPIPETGFIKPLPTDLVEASLNKLPSTKNNLTIDYVSPPCRGNNDLSYQYILQGVDEDWSKPNKNRTITFANLAPGDYLFTVRAVNQQGEAGRPAEFVFKILPPIYLRWWFITLAALFAGAVMYAFYRSRLQKLIEVERARTLIATDLHDDIGSDLSTISVLSEVLRLQLNNESQRNSQLLESIAELSRKSVISMSDIVWAINPKRDSILEITGKMREHAEEIFVPKGVTVKFSELEKGAKIKLSMNLRRDIFLIFKEAINNAAKYSNCTEIRINFYVKDKEIFLSIKDNGCGFDLSRQTNGNGLINMQSRVEKLKGKFRLESEINLGTTVEVHIPQK